MNLKPTVRFYNQNNDVLNPVAINIKIPLLKMCS